jgi:hypothetical protein
MSDCGNGYCLRCKQSICIQNPYENVTSRGQCMISGNCPHCMTKVNRFISAEQRANLFSGKSQKKSKSR